LLGDKGEGRNKVDSGDNAVTAIVFVFHARLTRIATAGIAAVGIFEADELVAMLALYVVP
jgi:hypothetical protein